MLCPLSEYYEQYVIYNPRVSQRCASSYQSRCFFLTAVLQMNAAISGGASFAF